MVDEFDYLGSRGSSSRAKKDDAANRISFARLSSLTSRCNSLIFAASDVVVPGLTPESISACLHQVRRVSGWAPTRSAIRLTAPWRDRDGSSALSSRTSRTARSLSSGGYFLGVGIASTFPWNYASIKPGTLQFWEVMTGIEEPDLLFEEEDLWVNGQEGWRRLLVTEEALASADAIVVTSNEDGEAQAVMQPGEYIVCGIETWDGQPKIVNCEDIRIPQDSHVNSYSGDATVFISRRDP